MTEAVFVIYATISLILLIYSAVEFSLLLNYLFRKEKASKKTWKELPRVTVQLPVYNERYVVERLIDRVAELDYPKEKLEIQVLDDSSDETVDLVAKKVTYYQSQGVDILHIRRENRSGFKAGALAEGLKEAKGEFIAIFDADFLPNDQFLMEAIGHFENEKVGVVQSRWTYINKNYSVLTRLQAVMLNTHFSVEQAGRNRSGAFINFNGTAGVWRKSCIEDAGGWEADTLTEDLDLSFRAQMKGWKFQYVMNLKSPSELPVTLPGYKAQQYRWSKGAAECVRKNMKILWKSNESSFWAKWIGMFHLLNSSVFLLVLGFILLSFPLAYSLQSSEETWFYMVIPIFFSSNILLLSVFTGGNLLHERRKWFDYLLFPIDLIAFLVVNMGISLYMVVGIIEGYLGKKSEFVRTPKFNIRSNGEGSMRNKYTNIRITPLLLFEVAIVSYGVFHMYYAISVGDMMATIFGAMFTIGFAYNISSTLYHSIVSE